MFCLNEPVQRTLSMGFFETGNLPRGNYNQTPLLYPVTSSDPDMRIEVTWPGFSSESGDNNPVLGGQHEHGETVLHQLERLYAFLDCHVRYLVLKTHEVPLYLSC